jgi:uncharacterized membrane protein
MGDIESWLRTGARGVALAAEAIGALIVAVALIGALLHYARDLVARTEPFPQERVRLGVGRALALALEFLLAADIVRTAVAPSWEEIGKLAAIAAIRTALNFFLQREIAAEERRLARGMADGGEG